MNVSRKHVLYGLRVNLKIAMERRKTTYSIVFSLAQLVLVFGGDFKSVPTTVKTHENDTVLLPCYLDGTGM